MSKIRFSPLLALVVVLAGCGGPTAPTVPTTYVLTSIDGHSLPAALNANDPHAARVVWETLTFDEHGIATRARTLLVASPAVEESSTQQFPYSVQDGFLTLGSHVCGPADICAEPESGLLTGGRLTLTVPGSTTAPVLLYQLRNLLD